MKREEQDKLWAELPEKKQNSYRNMIMEHKNHASERLQGIFDILEELFGKHNLQPVPTYEDVAEMLFENKNVYFGYDELEYECNKLTREGAKYALNCTTYKQLEKIWAINKLLNVAKFLNRNEDGSDWAPDWNNPNEDKFCIYFNSENESIVVDYVNYRNGNLVYFRTKELAKQAIEILREDIIKTALTTNY